MRRQRADQAGQLVEVVVARAEGRAELEEEAAELAVLGQRRDGVERRVGQAALQVLVEQHPAAPVGARAPAQLLGQRVLAGRVARQQAVELDVEAELLRRDRRPALDGPPARHGVEGRVDLDGVEVPGVVRQPVARRQPGRVPLLDEAGVGPARRPHTDARLHASVLPSRDGRPVRCTLR
jgi:hypothetical protein